MRSKDTQEVFDSFARHKPFTRLSGNNGKINQKVMNFLTKQQFSNSLHCAPNIMCGQFLKKLIRNLLNMSGDAGLLHQHGPKRFGIVLRKRSCSCGGCTTGYYPRLNLCLHLSGPISPCQGRSASH